MSATTIKLDEFTRAYVECALWSSIGDDGEPLDKSHSIDDIAAESLEKMAADCTSFQAHYGRILETARQTLNSAGELSAADWREFDDMAANLSRAGYHFWLTRNRHGAGFWDGDYPQNIGDALTKCAHEYGETDFYTGDDGQLYL